MLERCWRRQEGHAALYCVSTLQYLCWVCIGIAAKLLTAVRVLRPGVTTLLGPAHASGKYFIHVIGAQPAVLHDI